MPAQSNDGRKETMVRLKGSKTPEKGFWQLRGDEVEWPQVRQLYGPDLDFDLSVESIEHPERSSLVLVAAPDKRAQQTRSSLSAVRRRSLAERFKYKRR
jgi:hypothetical protein